MAKLTLTDLTQLSSNETSAVNSINNNNAAIEAALENTLSRDGTSPNSMTGDIDMNSNDLLNLGSVSFNSGPLADQVGYAEEWAQKAEDLAVSTDAGGDGATEFSALHHSAKASTSASAASTSASAASTSASTASTSASNASTSETNAAASASAASTSETNAATSESNASTSETNAAASAAAADVAKIEWQGTYNAGTAYALNDAVVYNGSSFINIQAGTGQTPAVGGTAYWDDLANKGADGVGSGDMISGVAVIDNLADVDTTTAAPTTGNALTWDGSNWTPGSGGGGIFYGDNGTTGSSGADIFRGNNATLTVSEEIPSTINASATGPVSVDTGVTLTVSGTLVII